MQALNINNTNEQRTDGHALKELARSNVMRSLHCGKNIAVCLWIVLMIHINSRCLSTMLELPNLIEGSYYIGSDHFSKCYGFSVKKTQQLKSI